MAAALLVAFVRCCVRALRASALRSRLRGLPACPPARSADIDCVAPLFFDGSVVRRARYIHVCWINSLVKLQSWCVTRELDYG